MNHYKSHQKQLYLFLLVTFFISSGLQATTIISFNINEVLEKAEFVFEGEVINVVTGMDDNDRWIVTDITFLVKDVIKGVDQGGTIELRFLGGEYAGRNEYISGMQYPSMGEKGIYFVSSLDAKMVNPLLGWTQGHFLIKEDNSGIERVTTSDGVIIEGMETNAVKEDVISNGQAVGIITGKTTKLKDGSLDTPVGMTASEFKQQLLNLGW